MIRFVGIPLVVGLLVVSLGACGGKDDSEQGLTHTTRSVEPDASWVDDGLDAAAPPDVAAPPADGGACPLEVVDLPSGTWMPRKPPRDSNACGAGQTSKVTAACEFTNSECATLGSAYAACIYCLYSRETDATYALRTYLPAVKREPINYRGYALRTGASETCGQALEDYAACLEAACACATANTRATCVTRARSGACKTIGVGTACIGQDAAKFLQPIIERGDFATQTEATTMAKVFCGGT